MKAIVSNLILFIFLIFYMPFKQTDSKTENEKTGISCDTFPETLIPGAFKLIDPNLGDSMIIAHRDSLYKRINRAKPDFPIDSTELYVYFPYTQFRDSIQKMIDLNPGSLNSNSNFGIRFYPTIYDTTTTRPVRRNMINNYLRQNQREGYQGRQSIIAAITLDSIIIPNNTFGVVTIYNLGGLVPPGKPPKRETLHNLLPH